MSLKISLSYILYLISYILFTIYSYSFLDIGLTFASFKPYLWLQKTMRYFGYSNHPASTLIFIILSILLFTIYYLLFNFVKQEKISLKKVLILSLIISGMLVFAYPSFSHDIFNYIFNAKMVLIYHVNPHIRSAWEFKDPMVDFMRNIHTPAPYFYGWTALSLIPFIVGLNRIFSEFISFKLFSALLFFFTFIILKKIIYKLKLTDAHLRLALFLLNPLILIEAIGVGHNDLAMMLPALLSLYFLIKYKESKKLSFFLFFVFFFLFSVSTKYATIVLLPLIVIWYFKNKIDIGFWGSILLFLIPFSRPLDQLHSWYLIWPLVWILLARNFKWIFFIYFLSFFALLRYTPYIWYGNWDPPVQNWRLIIYFLIPTISLAVMGLKMLLGKIKVFLLKTFADKNKLIGKKFFSDKQ